MPQTTNLGHAGIGMNNQSKRTPRYLQGIKGMSGWVAAVAITDIDTSVMFTPDAVTYAEATLPSGVVLDVNTGIISGTPAGEGDGTLVITATNANGDTASDTFAWSVAAA